MAKKRITRKKVNDPIVDSALRDIYDKIENLMPETPGKTSKRTPEIGDFQLIDNGNGEYVASTYTEQGWMVDLNSSYTLTSGAKDYRPSLGASGKSRVPIKGEALKYNRDNNVEISNSKQQRVLLKNDNNVLSIRNANDSDDARILVDSTIVVEKATSELDVAGQGQIWVKNEDPNELYFTNDDGEDIQITHNDHLAPTEQIRLQVRNDEGTTIPAGAPLYSKGEIGGSERILVGIADSSDANKMPCIGIAYEEMNTTSTKDNFAVLNGVYNTNITITSVAEQNTIYVAPHGGSSPYLTITRPTSSSHLVQNVGICIRQTATNTCAGMYVSSIGRTNDIPNELVVNHIANATSDTDKFLVSDSGTVKYRTGAEVLSDIGGLADSGDLSIAGTLNVVNTSNPPLKVSYDVNHFATFDMDSNGVLEIECTDGGAAESKLQLKNGSLTNDQYLVWGNSSETARITSNGAQNLLLNANEGTDSGYIEIQGTAANGDISIIPNGTGDVILGGTSGAVQFANNTFLDANGNALFQTAVASNAVNDLEIGNAATGGTVTLKSTGTDTNVALTVSTKGTGDMTLDGGGDIELNADGGNITFKDDTTDLFTIQSDEVKAESPFKVKESANAVADTANYGQIWIKEGNPNELAYTDDAGTDIIGVGKYMYDIQRVGYYSTVSTVSYLPLNGYIIEGTSSAGRNEFQAFVAPYNGTLEKIMWRSEAAQNGSFRNLIWESADGTEVPGTIMGRWDPSVNVADDTTVTFDFTTGATSGDNVLTKGNIYAISIDPVSIPYDTNATVVFKWDITS